MKTIGVALLVFVAAWIALAPAYAARKPKPTAASETQPNVPTADPATTGPLRAVYSAMPLSDRVSIQSDLIWTGDYNGVTDGQFSDRAIAAVKAFQRRNGGKDTGVLTSEERERLAAAAAPREDGVGWRLLDDPATGAQIGLPSALLPRTSTNKTGTHWQSARGEVQVDTFRISGKGATLASVLDQQKGQPAGRSVSYSAVKPDFFVISGVQNDVKKFYVRAHISNDEVRGIAILYDRAMEGILDKVVVAMSSAFTPFPLGEVAIETRMTRTLKRKVEYATGIIVSGAGDILTDREVIDGCMTVFVPGLGNAERRAEDKASGLALLRIYGAKDQTPVALATEGQQMPNLTIVGIADPQLQSGANDISTVKVRVSTASNVGATNVGAANVGRVIDQALPLGFSGAAATDDTGQVAGMVGLRPLIVASPPSARVSTRVSTSASTQAFLVSAQTVRDFLAAQNVALPAHATQSAKASIVRVVCVRN
jgi:peptidoglycan hydrolase-like protein with peptidoglycan-binding domain